MASGRDIMIAALAAALVGVLVGAFMTIAFITYLRRYRRHELPEFAFITTSMTRAKSSDSWRSHDSQSISLHSPSSTLKKKISEPMLLKNFEGKGVTLPPHISEMLGIPSKQACANIPPLPTRSTTTTTTTTATTATLRELSVASGLDEASRQPGVPMLLRQPRKSARNLRRGVGSIHSIASMYSEDSASSMSVSAAPNVPPESSLILSAHGGTFESVPVYKTGQSDTYYRTLTPSIITMAGASTRILDQPSMESSHFSPPGLSYYASHSRQSTSPPPDIPPRSPLRWKSVPNLK